MVTVTVAEAVAPLGPVAVTVQVRVTVTAVGVPEMTPVLVLRLSPKGSDGLIEKAVSVPVMVGVNGVMAVPTV
jgi:hypothetical protein